MPINYENKLTVERAQKNFVCDRCRKRYPSMDSAHVIRHMFGYSNVCIGQSVELVVCECCLLQMAFEWSTEMTEKQTSKPIKNTRSSPNRDRSTTSTFFQHDPVHPGEFLLEVYLKHAKQNLSVAAKLIGIDQKWLDGFVHAKNKLTRPVAEKLAEVYGGSAASWLAMQAHYDGSIKRLKIVIPSPVRTVSLKEMNNAIKRSGAKAGESK